MNKVKFNSNDLKQASSLTGRVVKETAINDAFRSVLINVGSKSAVFVGSDELVTVECSKPCSLADCEPFAFALEQADLTKLTKNLPAGVPVDIEVRDSTAFVQFGKTRAEYPTIDHTCCRKAPDVGDVTTIAIDGNTAMSIVSAVDFVAIGMELIAPGMCAVLLDGSENGLRVVGASTFGLYLSSEREAIGMGDRKNLIPPQAIKLLMAIGCESGFELLIPEAESYTHTVFQNGDDKLFVRMIDAQPFGYKSIKNPGFPDDWTRYISFDVNEFTNAVRVASSSVGADAKTGLVEISIKGEVVQVTFTDWLSRKKCTTEFNAASSENGDINVALNVTYLLTHLNKLSGTGYMRHNGENTSPMWFEDESKDAMQLLMPSRTN